MMKDEICFVSVGQCGGNIGVELEALGYDVLYVNTAASDLDALKGATHVYCIPGEKGCNQDPEKAKMIFAQHADEVVVQIKKFATKPLVYFISSCGGGTSGMTPLVVEHLLEQFDAEYERAWQRYEDNGYEGTAPLPRKIGLVSVMPSISESALLNANAYNFMKDVIRLTSQAFSGELSNMASTILLDNEREQDVMVINRKFAKILDKVFRIPTEHVDVRGNVDEADLNRAFTAPGVCVINLAAKGRCTARDIIDGVRHNKLFTDTEDTSGMYWVSSTTEPLDTLSIEKELGAPKTHFITYNDECEIFLVSGMGFPKERMSIMAMRAKEFQKTAQKAQMDMEQSFLQEDLGFMSTPIKVKRATENKRVDSNADGNLLDDFENRTSQAVKQQSVQDKLALLKQRRIN